MVSSPGRVWPDPAPSPRPLALALALALVLVLVLVVQILTDASGRSWPVPMPGGPRPGVAKSEQVPEWLSAAPVLLVAQGRAAGGSHGRIGAHAGPTESGAWCWCPVGGPGAGPMPNWCPGPVAGSDQEQPWPSLAESAPVAAAMTKPGHRGPR